MLSTNNITSILKGVPSDSVIMTLSPDGYISSCSSNTETLYNINRENFADFNLFDFIHEEDIVKCENVIDNLAQGLTVEIDFRIKSTEGLLKECKGVIFQLPYEYTRLKNEIIWFTSLQQTNETGAKHDYIKNYNFIIAEKSNKIIVNNELKQIIGIENNEDIFEFLFNSERRRFDPENFLNNLKEGEFIIYEILIKNKENKYLSYKANIYKYFSGDKDILIMILGENLLSSSQILEFDSSDIYELQMKIDERDKFFSLIAHDLRSPFTAILGYSEYMASYYENLTREEIHDFSNNMYKASKSVFKLLEDLLKWTRIQSGRINLDKKKFSIVQTLDNAVDMFRTTAENKNIRLIYTKPEIKIFINADEEMISSVIRNLISNAIKFTDVGGFVKVSVNVNDQFVIISVIDNGIGIDNITLSKLFKVGERVTRYGTNDEEGSGLGLILSKEFIKKNGGDIFVKSKIGEGSTFTIELPIYRD